MTLRSEEGDTGGVRMPSRHDAPSVLSAADPARGILGGLRRPSFLSRLDGRDAAKAVLFNSGWLLFDRAFRIGLGVFVGAWVARFLGPSEFGKLSYVIAYIAFFQALAGLGMDNIIVRDISRDPSSAPQILGTAFVLRLATGAVCWFVATFGSGLMSHGDRSGVTLSALVGGTLVFQAADTIDLWFQSQSQSRRTVVAKLASYLVSCGIKVALILGKAPLVAFAGVMTFDALVAAGGLVLAYRRFPASGRWHVVLGKGVELLRESWPFLLSGLSIVIYLRIDQIMIKSLLGVKALGIYCSVLPLSQVWYVIPVTLVTSLAPFIARKRATGRRAYELLFINVFRGFGALSLVIVSLTVLAAPLLIRILYGDAYSTAIPILRVHVLSLFFVFQGVAQGLWLTNEGGGRLGLAQTALGAIAAVISNWFLLPRLGVMGSAVSAVIALGVSGVFSNLILAPRLMLMQFGIRPRGLE
jgi:O-antigen/teichoic acid export membrane protein